MSTRDVGDRVNVEYLSYNASGVLTNATVVLTVTDPSGDVTTPSVTNTSTGTYDASFTLSETGVWSWVWTVSGTVVDTTPPESVLALNPGPRIYASVPEVKALLGITDTTEDGQINDALVTSSRFIDHHCRRSFNFTNTATARVFHPENPCLAIVDDFWSTEGLVIATDAGDDGTYETTLTASDYQLEPLNGMVDGEPGWPYYRIRAVGAWFPCGTVRPPLQITAKWGWAAIPGPVKQACAYLAMEVVKLRGAPFGVANTDQFGPIRIRDNARVAAMLAPYRLNPILVG